MEMEKENLEAMALLKQPMSWGGGTTGLNESCLFETEKELRDMFGYCQSCQESSEPKQRSKARGYSLLSETYLPGATGMPLLEGWDIQTTLLASDKPEGIKNAHSPQERSKLGQSLKHVWIPFHFGLCWSQLVTETRNQPGRGLHFQSSWVKWTAWSS